MIGNNGAGGVRAARRGSTAPAHKNPVEEGGGAAENTPDTSLCSYYRGEKMPLLHPLSHTIDTVCRLMVWEGEGLRTGQQCARKGL